VWGEIVATADTPVADWNWTATDAVFTAAAAAELDVMITLWPYALWDQVQCHATWPSTLSLYGTHFQAPYAPCDWTAYNQWVTAVVERYGDQVNTWQIMQLPEQQTSPLAFYQGSAQDYAEIARVTSADILAAQPAATIVSGTIGPPTTETITFWGPLLEQNIQDDFTALLVMTDTPEQFQSTQTWLERYPVTQSLWARTTSFDQASAFEEDTKVFYTNSHD
jgi:hypothetical protein